jgi:hypothetical protein
MKKTINFDWRQVDPRCCVQHGHLRPDGLQGVRQETAIQGRQYVAYMQGGLQRNVVYLG